MGLLIRYIIWTTTLDDTNNIISTLTEHSNVILSITDKIVCVETTKTLTEIREFMGDELEMACLEIDDKFIAKLMNTKFKQEEKTNFNKFLEMTKTAKTIDELLDIIIERGGVQHLTKREKDKLDKLTSKPTNSK